MQIDNVLLIFQDARYIEIPLKAGIHKCFFNGQTLCEYDFSFNKNNLIIEDVPLSSFERTKINNIDFLWMSNEKKAYELPRNSYVTIGRAKANDVCLLCSKTEVAFYIEEKRIHIEFGEVYKNGCLIAGDCKYQDGDSFFIDGYKITLQTNCILVEGKPENFRVSFNELCFKEIELENMSAYKRSPRIVKTVPEDKITIAAPPTEDISEKDSLLKKLLPTIIMFAMTVIVMIIQPRGIYAIIGISSTLMSIIMTLSGYFSDKKIKAEKKENTIKSYNAYLLQKSKELYKLKRVQCDALEYNYPSPKNIADMIMQNSSRLYERNSYDDDFLTISVGKAVLPASYQISLATQELNMSQDNELAQEAQRLNAEFASVKNLPVMVNLSDAHVGFVGEKRYVHRQLVSLFFQLTFFQSYHDLEIVMLCDGNNASEFSWVRWFPHLKIKAINVTGFVDKVSIGDQVLNSLNQLLKQRKTNLDENKKISQFLPHYVFIIDEPRLILEHSIMEFLQGNEKLGFSIVYTSESQASLPENIKTIVSVGSYEKGILEMNEGRLIKQSVDFYDLPSTEPELCARRLAAVNHVKGMSTQIPASITFFEMYGIRHPEELHIAGRWKKNQSHKTLAVPLGVRGKDDYVELNLHEKAHGPHGLVAGTTGSGKSEIVQSYILSLAVNFHPYEVGFLLIDYKGGGMASLFRNLPHLLGMITNLDGSESMRAMASIKSELSRRQTLFSEHGVNHINQYNQLYKKGEAKKPMPHLFLISDEFAELKKEQPEFMSELVSTARIGRSLGIHLILATQKPTGVVDDQIWSNSKFKLALKVQNKSDSNEVLKTPDAADITLPGRAYLQVGNNEIYELFQSAWSGAPYTDSRVDIDFDKRIYEINSLGQRRLLGKDLSGDEQSETQTTQLDAVVSHISEVFSHTGLPVVERPWHPSLGGRITSPHFCNISDVSAFEKLDTKIALGMVDIPEEQVQKEYTYDLRDDGNMAVFGSSTSGKSVTLTTLLMSIAVKNTPNMLKYYILDFGNASLVTLKDLPHTADYVSIDDTDKLKKILKTLDSEIAARKAKLSAKNAMNFSMYNQISDDKISAIFVVIDNFDALREMDAELSDYFTRYSRDGMTLGLFLAISALRASSVKFNMINNFKTKIAHYLMDRSDYHSLVGRSAYEHPEISGRSFVKLSNTNMMQVYTVVPYENDMDYITQLGQKVNEINQNNSGAQAQGVKMLPDILTMEMLAQSAQNIGGKIAIGLDRENVEPVYIELSQEKQVIVGGPQSGKTTLLKIILNSVQNHRLFIFDSKNLELFSYRDNDRIEYAGDYTEFVRAAELLESLIGERVSLYENSDKSVTPKVFYSNMEPVRVIIDDIDNFVEKAKTAKKEKLVLAAKDVEIRFIGTSLSSRLRGFDETSKFFKESLYGVILGHPSEQMVWSIDGMRKYKPMPDGALVYSKGNVTEIKIPRI